MTRLIRAVSRLLGRATLGAVSRRRRCGDCGPARGHYPASSPDARGCEHLSAAGPSQAVVMPCQLEDDPSTWGVGRRARVLAPLTRRW